MLQQPASLSFELLQLSWLVSLLSAVARWQALSAVPALPESPHHSLTRFYTLPHTPTPTHPLLLPRWSRLSAAMRRPPAPAAMKVPHAVTFHNRTWDDPYFWMTSENNVYVKNLIAQENR